VRVTLSVLWKGGAKQSIKQPKEYVGVGALLFGGRKREEGGENKERGGREDLEYQNVF
jgi:hypothetical protein